jgi:polysaccharide pyruvyl transferase WcaK-like protein
MIAHSEFLIGMRLHSIIYAMISSTAVMPVIYEDKVDSLAKMAGLKDYALNVNDIKSQDAVQKLKILTQEKSAIQAHMLEFASQMKIKERDNVCLPL